MNKRIETRFWKFAWPEWAFLGSVATWCAFAICLHRTYSFGTPFKIGEIMWPEPSSAWDFIWAAGSYSAPVEWWHGLGVTIGTLSWFSFLLLYTPLRFIMLFIIMVKKRKVHNEKMQAIDPSFDGPTA